MACYDGCSLQDAVDLCDLNCTVPCEQKEGTWTVTEAVYNGSTKLNSSEY